MSKINDLQIDGQITGADKLIGSDSGSSGSTRNYTVDGIKNYIVAELNLADVATSGSYTDLVNTPAFADVATSGSYTDLINKPDLSVLDDVLSFSTETSFPATGESGKVYIAEDTGFIYRWNGSEYVQLTDQTAIWGNITGTITNQSDLINVLDTKEDVIIKNTAFNKDFGTTSGTVVEGGTVVDSINGQNGVVVLDADDIDDASTANKFTSQSDIDRLANTSGTNTGDQDLSVYALKSNVLELDNSVIYTPTSDYHPATRKYVNDSISSSGGGDMLKSTYDTDNDGVVDNAEALNGSTGAFYLDRTNHTGTQTASTISDFDTEVSNNTDVSSTKASIGDLTYTPDSINNLTYANGTYDFGSNILKYANVIDLESELTDYDPAIYHGMTIHVHETGALYYAHAGAWRKLLTDTTYNSVSGYTDSLSDLAYSGDYTDLTNTPVLATVASTGSYNDLTDTPTLAAVASTGDYTDLINKPDLSVLNDTIIEPTLNDFPATGSVDVVYIAEDTGYMYRWNGTDYTQLTDQTAIWGNISGTLSEQTDLQNALDSKADITDLDSYVDLTTNQTVGGVKNFTDNIGVKTASPTEDFEVTGNQRINNGSLGVNVAPNSTDGTISASGDVIAFASDSRLKTNSEDIDKPLDKVKALRGFTYNWNELAKDKAGFDTTQKQVGVSAQDVQKTLPEAVKLAPFDNDGNDKSISGENYLTVQYDKIVPLLIEAIKEQQTQIEELKKLIK